MPQHDEKHVITRQCTIIWDSMTRPDTNESGTKHGFKVAIHPQNPDVPLLEALANKALMESDFKGVLPNNGTMPLGTLGPNDAGGMFNGWRVFTAGTYRGFPQCFDENGQALDPMVAGPMIYPGQMVDLLVHAYSNNGKVKGVALGLDGFVIVASANAQRLNLGGSTVDAAAAFGAQPAPVVQPQHAPAQQPTQQPAAPAPGQAPAQQPYVQPQQPAAGQQPYAPAQQPVQQPTQQPAAPAPGQAPVQANNYLPQQ